MTNKTRKILQNLLIIGVAVAIGILIFPSFMDALNDAHQVATIGGYEETLEDLNESEISKLKRDAVAYNEKIYAQQKQVEFIYQGEEYEDEEYDSILSPLNSSLVMGYIEIPRINVYLPITHGTRTEDLKYQVGHMRGTSVPIGGESTHAVIAAHTGLQNADLFTDVVDLEIGDVFYIHVLNEIHVYTVDQINVVLPGEEVPYLQIENEKDYITLFTCTPYGVNDHRLLVRGARTYPDLVYHSSEGGTADVSSKNIQAILLTIAYGLIPIAIAIIGLILVNRKKKPKNAVKSESQTNEVQNIIDELLRDLDKSTQEQLISDSDVNVKADDSNIVNGTKHEDTK